MTPDTSKRLDSAQVTPGAGDLTTPVTLGEVTHLWWFCDGAIMDVGTREHLRRSWGLCPRHAWLYFRAENELKYQPLGNAVLLHDLVTSANEVLKSHHRARAKWRKLSTVGTCLTCDHLTVSRPGRSAFAGDLDVVRLGTRTTRWMAGSSAVWQRRRCPICLRPGIDLGSCSALYPDGILCRVHVISRHSTHETVENTTEKIAGYLATLGPRLTGCVKSMTADGPARTADTDAALVEAIGWLAGWR